MENEIRMTKLAECAGCGAKVGAGTLSKLLNGLPLVQDAGDGRRIIRESSSDLGEEPRP